MSLKWSGIYETSVMPHLFIPILKESFGITDSKFKVTDKSRKANNRKADLKAMTPFIILVVLSVIAIIRVLFMINMMQILGLLTIAEYCAQSSKNYKILIIVLFPLRKGGYHARNKY